MLDPWSETKIIEGLRTCFTKLERQLGVMDHSFQTNIVTKVQNRAGM